MAYLAIIKLKGGHKMSEKLKVSKDNLIKVGKGALIAGPGAG